MGAESSFHRCSVPEEDHTVEAEVGVGPDGEDLEDEEVIVEVGAEVDLEEGEAEDLDEVGVGVIQGEEVTQGRIQDE